MTTDRVVVIVIDGLRPDSVNVRDTPNLAGIRQRGVAFTHAHAALPAVTLVNGAVLATGRHPAATGVVGNNMFVPEVDSGTVLGLTDATSLDRLGATTGGIVRTITLAEHLEKHDRRLVVVGSGSAGTTMCASPGALVGANVVINCDSPEAAGRLSIPDWIGDEVLARFGPPPTKQRVADRRASVSYATRVVADYVLPEVDPDIALLWSTEPDFTQHAHDVGSPRSLSVLRHVDGCVGMLVDSLERRGVLGSTDIVVVSDHGCTKLAAPAPDVVTELISAGLKAGPGSDDVVVADNGSLGIHVRDHDAALVRDIVRLLQRQPWTGALFTPAAQPASSTLDGVGRGWVEGTFSLELIHLADARGSPDILLTPGWTADRNEFGVAGTTHFARGADRSNHGGLSPWDIASTLIASGPSFKDGVVVSTPAGNVDVAPTLLALVGVDDHLDSVDGRVLSEAFPGGGDPAAMAVETKTLVTAAADSPYRAAIRVSTADGVRYVDKGWRLPP